MKKCHTLLIALIGIASLASAETNALIEVKLFKDWVIKGECGFCNLAIKNTGTAPIRLTKDAIDFSMSQLYARSLPAKHAEYFETEIETRYKILFFEEVEFFDLLPGETHVYEGRKFLLPARAPFSEEMRSIVSIYLGKGFWLDSEPLTVNGVTPDSEEDLGTIANNELARQGKNLHDTWKLVAITYKNERWLCKKSLPNPQLKILGGDYYSVCPLSLTNKIRVEPHDDKGLFKIWDGDKSMIYDMYKSIIIEGPDENNVLGKWTRERKQKAEADNAEVRRKKAEAEK